MNNSPNHEPNQVIETAEERKQRFLLEFDQPFKCDKCNERFKKKKYLRKRFFQMPVEKK